MRIQKTFSFLFLWNSKQLFALLYEFRFFTGIFLLLFWRSEQQTGSAALTYIDFFPSFINTGNTNCSDNCLNCNDSGCTACIPGYSLEDFSCYRCPDNCFECFSDSSSWTEAHQCTSNSTSYYFSNGNFYECSSGCSHCISESECISCFNNTYYLHFNNPSNYSCNLCSLDSVGCTKCVFSNYTMNIDYNIYKNISQLQEFIDMKSALQWEIFCLQCESSPIAYALKYDYICYPCSLISDCLSCAFVNETSFDFSVYIAGDSLPTLFTSEETANMLMRCSSCSAGYIPTISLPNNKFTQCEMCDSLISNCDKCAYFYMMDSSQPSSVAWDMLILNSAQDLTIICIECANGYGVNNITYLSCGECPSNCEYCYLNNSEYFCGRCLNNYVLNISDGTCESINQVSIPANYIAKCDRIISSNPWKSLITSQSDFLCQSCINSSEYPSILGSCQGCSTSSCSKCYEGNSANNYTNYLTNKPAELMNIITNTTSVSSLIRCMSCISDIYAYDDSLYTCCQPQFLLTTSTLEITVIQNCEMCSQCTQEKGTSICSSCSQCANVNQTALNSEVTINNTMSDSSLYAKKIYYILKTEAYQFSTVPTLNDSLTYNMLYAGLNSIKQVDLAASSTYSCSPCLISGNDCIKPDNFIYDSSVYTVGSTNLNTQLTYQLQNKECRPGFIYDKNIDRCKFCPNNWTTCEAYKKFVFTFTSTKTDPNDPFLITNLNSLYLKLNNLNTQIEFYYILNEFAVTSMETIVEFPTNEDTLLYYDSFEVELESYLLNVVKTLKNNTLIFQPENYNTNNQTIAEVNWACSMKISGFSHVIFRNLKFSIIPYYFGSASENASYSSAYTNYVGQFVGIFSSVDNVVFENCYFQHNENSSYSYLDGVFGTTTSVISFLYGPSDFFMIFMQNAKNVTIKNVICSLNLINALIYFPQISLNLFFLGIESEYLALENISFADSSFENYILIYIGAKDNIFSIKNITFLASSFNNSYYIQASAGSLTFDGLSFVDCSVKISNLVALSNTNNLDLSNIMFDSCYFEGNLNYSQNTAVYYNIFTSFHLTTNNISFKNTNALYVRLFSISNTESPLDANMPLVIQNIIVENSTFFSFTTDFLFFWVQLSNPGAKSNNISFENITFSNCEYHTSLYSFTPSHFLFVSTSYSISFRNIAIIDCYNISGFSLSNINSILINNFSFTNKESPYYSQIALLITEVSEIQFFEGKFLNIYSGLGIIYIQNTRWSPSNTLELATFSNISICNATIRAIEVQQLSSICFISKTSFNISISDSFFSNLSVIDDSFYQLSSAAIFVDSIESTLYIMRSTFLNISTTSTMSAGYFMLSMISILDSTLMQASFFSNFTDVYSLGGFFNIQTINLNIYNTNFSYAFAMFGGALYVKTMKNSEINITHCRFNQNYATIGGVFYIITTQSSKTGILFSENVIEKVCAFSEGGAFFISNSFSDTNEIVNIIIKNSMFSNVNSKTGAIISTSYPTISLINTLIQDNFNVVGNESAENLKGAITGNISVVGCLFVVDYTTFLMDSCNFTNLVASNANALILTITNGQFIDNKSQYMNIIMWKSGFYSTYSSISLNNTVYKNITAEKLATQIVATMYGFFYLLSQNSLIALNISVEAVDCSSCTAGGGFIHSESSSSIIQNSKFSRISSYLGGVFYASSNKLDVDGVTVMKNSMENCVFNYSSALSDGGVLYLENSYITIVNSSFNYNNANNGSGGCIVFKSPTSYSFMNITNSLFFNNSATIGGAIYYQDVAIYLNSTIFINNYAPVYGINLFSYPKKLRIVENSTISRILQNETNSTNQSSVIEYYNSDNFSFNDLRSGSTLPTIALQLLDEENNIILPTISQNNFELQGEFIFPKGDYVFNFSESAKTISGVFLNSDGYFIIQNIEVIGPPLTEINLQLRCQSIEIPDENGNFQIGLYNFTFPISIRDCIIGELNQIDSSGICLPCINGAFSYNTLDIACTKCLDGLICGNETGVTEVKSSYWRRDNFSLYILKCINLETNCVGGYGADNELCYEGHIGARCEACDLRGTFWNKSYARGGTYQCVDCSSVNYNYIFLALLSLFSFISMVISIKGTISSIDYFLKIRLIKKISRFSMLKADEETSSIYIKIYMTYLQIVQVIGKLNLTMPQSLKVLPDTVGNPVASALYSTDCFIALFELEIPVLYIKLIIALIIPFIYLILFVAGYLLYSYNKTILRKLEYLYTVCLFTLIYFQPSVLQALMQVLACVTIGDKSYIKGDVSFFCYTQEYYYYSFFIGIPALLLWGIVTPGVILWRIIKNRDKLERITILVRYGYFYKEYKIYYWEFVKMFVKILVTLFLEFYETEIQIKGLLILLVLAVYYGLIIKFQPYKKFIFTRTDKISTMICFITIFFGVLIYCAPGFNYLITLSYIIIVVANIWFNLFILRYIIGSYTSKIDELIEKIQEKLEVVFHMKTILRKKKEFTTKEKWLTVRRLAARYLREKERVILRNKEGKKQSLNYCLSLIDYDPNVVSYKKLKEVKNTDFEAKMQITQGNIYSDKDEEKKMLDSKKDQKEEIGSNQFFSVGREISEEENKEAFNVLKKNIKREK